MKIAIKINIAFSLNVVFLHHVYWNVYWLIINYLSHTRQVSMLLSDQSVLAFETRELTEVHSSSGSTSALQDYIDYIVSFHGLCMVKGKLTRLSFCKGNHGETKGSNITSTVTSKFKNKNSAGWSWDTMLGYTAHESNIYIAWISARRTMRQDNPFQSTLT